MKLAIAIVLVLAAHAAADPALPRVLTAPTAWLPAENTVVGMAGLDQRGDGAVDLDYGLGGLAAVELGADTDVRACTMPPCGTANIAPTEWQARAAFRIGARQDVLFVGQPAVVFGVRTAIGHDKVGEAYVVASRVIGLVRLHAGVGAMDAQQRGFAAMGTQVRPLAGLELTPPQYPKTSLMGDVAWLPRYELTTPTPERVIGIGVRYQALAWASIELDVRNRQDEGLQASTVMVRINGVLGRTQESRR